MLESFGIVISRKLLRTPNETSAIRPLGQAFNEVVDVIWHEDVGNYCELFFIGASLNLQQHQVNPFARDEHMLP